MGGCGLRNASGEDLLGMGGESERSAECGGGGWVSDGAGTRVTWMGDCDFDPVAVCNTGDVVSTVERRALSSSSSSSGLSTSGSRKEERERGRERIEAGLRDVRALNERPCAALAESSHDALFTANWNNSRADCMHERPPCKIRAKAIFRLAQCASNCALDWLYSAQCARERGEDAVIT